MTVNTNEKKIIAAATKAVLEWREWHKPEYGDFPHHDLITAMNELDELIPGKKAGEDD